MRMRDASYRYAARICMRLRFKLLLIASPCFNSAGCPLPNTVAENEPRAPEVCSAVPSKIRRARAVAMLSPTGTRHGRPFPRARAGQAIKVSTIDGNDVRVMGPDSFSQLAT